MIADPAKDANMLGCAELAVLCVTKSGHQLLIYGLSDLKLV